jgi:two-component system sensor histidine kinase ChvG
MDGLDRVEDPKLRSQAVGVARDDVVRLDRLINDISEAARTDADSRAPSSTASTRPADRATGRSWETAARKGDARIAFARPRKNTPR